MDFEAEYWRQLARTRREPRIVSIRMNTQPSLVLQFIRAEQMNDLNKRFPKRVGTPIYVAIVKGKIIIWPRPLPDRNILIVRYDDGDERWILSV